MIREYRKSDDQAIIQIWFDASIISHNFIHKDFWVLEKKNVEEKYLPMAETFVKEVNGNVVGFISLIDNYIGALFISPEHQGKGIGTELINKAKSIRKELGVEVYKDNQKAYRFYEKCGFLFLDEKIQPETGCLSVSMKLCRE